MNQSKEKPLKKQIVLSLFEDFHIDDDCGGNDEDHCKCLDRVVQVLDCMQFLRNNELGIAISSNTEFIAFCDDTYPPHRMMDDYIHFMHRHADPKSIESIRKRMHFHCESAADCDATKRHYRDRGDAEGTTESNWSIDQMDSIHCMVYHLYELGLRVPTDKMLSDTDFDDEKHSESFLVDHILKRMATEIALKRSRFSTKRLDGASNTKFTLKIEAQNEGGRDMESDGMFSVNSVHCIFKMKDYKSNDILN